MINASHFVVSSFSVNFFFLPSLAALGWPPFLLRIQSGFAWDFSFHCGGCGGGTFNHGDTSMNAQSVMDGVACYSSKKKSIANGGPHHPPPISSICEVFHLHGLMVY